MLKYSGPDDIFRDVVEESDENWLLGLLAFAMVEEQRIEWARHRLETTGRPPAPADAQAWYESQPRGVVVRALAEAESALKTYGNDAIEEFDETYRREIAQGVVVAEIRKLGRWAPQLGMNVLGGLIGSTAFTTLLIIIGLLVLNEPSANALARKLQQPTETAHDEVRRN